LVETTSNEKGRWLKMLAVKPLEGFKLPKDDILKVFYAGVWRATRVELEDFTPIEDPSKVNEIKEFEKVLNENKTLLEREYKKEYKPILYGRTRDGIIALLLIKDLEDNHYYIESRNIESFTKKILMLKEEVNNMNRLYIEAAKEVLEKP
jgi:hypothetical protein